jgi:hypothetical protein
MSLSSFALSEPAIAQAVGKDPGKTPPPKRTVTAVRDSAVQPEAR